MSTTVTYKGNTLTTVNNSTKVLKTIGKYMEDDITLVDISEGQGIVITDELDSHGGTIRHINGIVISGAQNITENGTYDVTEYASVDINVPTGGTPRTSSDLTVNGATVTAPAGTYATAASKSIASGIVTAPASISGTAATVTTGTNTLTLTKTVSVTPSVTTIGYVSSGTAGNSSVSLTASVTTQAAQTIYPSTSDQTIAASRYLTGTQTVKAVKHNLDASKILSGTTFKIGDSSDDDRVASVAGTLAFQTIYSGTSTPSSSTGVNGDIYIKT